MAIDDKRAAHEETASTGRRGGQVDAAAYRGALEHLPREDLLAELVRLRTLVEQLQTALDSRVIIEQAKGVLAERLRLRVPEAFELLRFAARSEHLRVQDLARAVVSDEGTPGPVVRALSRQMRWRARSQIERDQALRERAERVYSSHRDQVARLRQGQGDEVTNPEA